MISKRKWTHCCRVRSRNDNNYHIFGIYVKLAVEKIYYPMKSEELHDGYVVETEIKQKEMRYLWSI